MTNFGLQIIFETVKGEYHVWAEEVLKEGRREEGGGKEGKGLLMSVSACVHLSLPPTPFGICAHTTHWPNAETHTCVPNRGWRYTGM